jgi:hypothetical protein
VAKLLLLLGSSLVLTGAGSAATEVCRSSHDIPVRTTRADEVRPVASTNAVAWAARHWSASHRSSHYDTYVQVGKAKPVKVNAPGTSALPGGISGDTLVFEQWHRGHANIVFYSVQRKARFAPPAGVNSNRGDEFSPSLSGRWLAFFRQDSSGLKALLRDLESGEVIQVRGFPPFPGGRKIALRSRTEVNGNFAAFNLSTQAWAYDISKRRFSPVLSFSGIPELSWFPGSISRTGTAYAALHALIGSNCDDDSLRRLTEREDATPITTVPREFRIGFSYTVDRDAQATIYYERVNCTTGRSDIYKTVDATPHA